mmetsp:Transcript_1218/g.2683  ORF Transcript_1218/g.2683 Transcript_1218/m.2683 type:complete len:243 (-) Transcript_1218:509-1237(-)
MERGQSDHLCHVVPAHLARRHVGASVPKQQHGASCPRLVGQRPRSDHGVRHPAGSYCHLASQLPPDGHREHGVEEHCHDVHGRISHRHARNTHEAAHSSGLGGEGGEQRDPSVVDRGRMFGVSVFRAGEHVGHPGDSLRAEAGNHLGASSHRVAQVGRLVSCPICRVTLRDVTTHHLNRPAAGASGGQLGGGGGARVPCHDPDAHAGGSEAGDDAATDATGAAHYEDQLVSNDVVDGSRQCR